MHLRPPTHWQWRWREPWPRTELARAAVAAAGGADSEARARDARSDAACAPHIGRPRTGARWAAHGCARTESERCVRAPLGLRCSRQRGSER